MTRGSKNGIALVLAIGLISGGALAQRDEHEHEHGGAAAPHAQARQAEAHPGPQGYQRAEEPKGWNNRPAQPDRGAYQHNYQAAHNYRIGAYRRPPGWVDRHWGYGEFLPRAFWAAPYVLADYWLFGLEVAPVGYEWVRYGSDALLVNMANGQVLQAVYGVFM